jgi:hypothetical protein
VDWTEASVRRNAPPLLIREARAAWAARYIRPAAA